MPVKIKVCGMTQAQQLNALEEMGVDLAGLIFYDGSSRYVRDKLTANDVKQFKTISKVGVFVNATHDEIMRTADNYSLDMVQLHGDESPVFCEKLANYITVIKAFRVSENDPLEWMIAPYKDACDMLMFDTLGSGYGGTGKKFKWSILTEQMMIKSFFLSGGIEPGDETALISFAKNAGDNLFAIDINSRFETEPGVKDLNKIRTFIKNIEEIR